MSKRKTKVYVSGAITWVEKASARWRKQWLRKLEESDFKVFDPLLHDDKQLESQVNTIVRRDIRRILTSDVVLVNGNYPSWGSAMEVIYSRIFGTKVYTVYDKPKEAPVWLTYHSDRVFKSLDDFLAWFRITNQKEVFYT